MPGDDCIELEQAGETSTRETREGIAIGRARTEDREDA